MSDRKVGTAEAPKISCRNRLERIALDLEQVDRAMDGCDAESVRAIVARVHGLRKKFDNIINTLNDLDELSSGAEDDHRVAAVLLNFKRVVSR